ncbi:MAG: hypothetical protein KBD28_10765 [Chitinophagaceae bacterium]|jgi:hypothetical protein|nr:hypothetical protein [Chitinophagaceae bacterium]
MRKIENVNIYCEQSFNSKTKIEEVDLPVQYYFSEISKWRKCGRISNIQFKENKSLIAELTIYSDDIDLTGLYPVATFSDNRIIVVSLQKGIENHANKDMLKPLEKYPLITFLAAY